MVRAYMLFIIYKVVRKMHRRYAHIFHQRLANVSPHFFDSISTVYRYSPLGGVRPHITRVGHKTSVDEMFMLDLVQQCVLCAEWCLPTS